MTTVVGDATGWGVEPQRLQWSHAWLGVGLAGALSGAVSVFPPLWQMTENGSSPAAAAWVAIPPQKAVCMAIAVIAIMLRIRLTRARMLSSDHCGGLPDYRCGVLR